MRAGNAAGRVARPGERQEDGVSEFADLEKKAEAYAQEHPEQAGQAINEVAGSAEHDTDHQHDEQIDRAVDAAEQRIEQDQPGNQNLPEAAASWPWAQRDSKRTFLSG
jgi:MT0933-like antitoxin protein